MTLNVPSWSTSSIESYHNCPYRYYREKVAKDIKWQESEHAKFGLYLHERMEERLRNGRPLPQDLLEQCPSLEEHAAEILSLGGDLLLEHKMAITRSLTATEWFAKDAWGRAAADVLVLRDDEAIVWDWKTGKPRDPRLQSHVLAFITFCVFPDVRKVSTTFAYVRHGVRKDNAYDRDDDLPFLADYISDQLVDVSFSHHNDAWPKRPSGLCGWCPVEECEHHVER